MKEKLSTKKVKLIEVKDDWHKVIYHDDKPKKVKRKRINAKTPPLFKKTGGKKPGRQLNYKFKDPDD